MRADAAAIHVADQSILVVAIVDANNAATVIRNVVFCGVKVAAIAAYTAVTVKMVALGGVDFMAKLAGFQVDNINVGAWAAGEK